MRERLVSGDRDDTWRERKYLGILRHQYVRLQAGDRDIVGDGWRRQVGHASDHSGAGVGNPVVEHPDLDGRQRLQGLEHRRP